jgi:hypothetical protein
VRGKTILFGDGQAFSNDVWEFDGTTWEPVDVPPPLPGGRLLGVLTYDGTNGRTVLAGGNINNADTWVLEYADTNAREACRAGIDQDGDGLIGCADDDCWGVCKGACPPRSPVAACAARPMWRRRMRRDRELPQLLGRLSDRR